MLANIDGVIAKVLNRFIVFVCKTSGRSNFFWTKFFAILCIVAYVFMSSMMAASDETNFWSVIGAVAIVVFSLMIFRTASSNEKRYESGTPFLELPVNPFLFILLRVMFATTWFLGGDYSPDDIVECLGGLCLALYCYFLTCPYTPGPSLFSRALKAFKQKLRLGYVPGLNPSPSPS